MKTNMFTDCVITVSVKITESHFTTSPKDVFPTTSERNEYLCNSHGRTASSLGLKMCVMFFSIKFNKFLFHDVICVQPEGWTEVRVLNHKALHMASVSAEPAEASSPFTSIPKGPNMKTPHFKRHPAGIRMHLEMASAGLPKTHTHTHTHIYIYICVCVCVCVFQG